jgi:hypothetical protein
MKLRNVLCRLLLLCLLLLVDDACQAAAIMLKAGGILAIASHRREYEEKMPLKRLQKQQHGDDHDGGSFSFGRSQSPGAVKRALQGYSGRSPLTFFQGKDGRQGNVSTTKLGGDWVLAESEQIAVNCTTEEVLLAYLSGNLQRRWNKDTVLDCTIARKEQQQHQAYYQQDLVLRSQRVIRRHTGIMRYSQRIFIDKVGMDSYCVSIRLDPSAQNTTARKPFESLSVYVNLLQEARNVRVYAAGLMKVNRKVVPNLVVFDASGIAGSMAGKGTLWLAAYFDERAHSPRRP